MKKNMKILIPLIVTIVIILIGLYFINKASNQEKISPTENTKTTGTADAYPDYRIKGTVMSVDINEGIIKLKANTSLIKGASRNLMEKNIVFNENTECVLYKVAVDATETIECSEIKKDDNLLITTVESTYEEIDKLEDFTATKIAKAIP